MRVLFASATYLCMRFIKVIVLPPLSAYFSIFVFSHVCVRSLSLPCRLKFTALCAGVKTLYNTILRSGWKLETQKRAKKCQRYWRAFAVTAWIFLYQITHSKRSSFFTRRRQRPAGGARPSARHGGGAGAASDVNGFTFQARLRSRPSGGTGRRWRERVSSGRQQKRRSAGCVTMIGDCRRLFRPRCRSYYVCAAACVGRGIAAVLVWILEKDNTENEKMSTERHVATQNYRAVYLDFLEKNVSE